MVFEPHLSLCHIPVAVSNSGAAMRQDTGCRYASMEQFSKGPTAVPGGSFCEGLRLMLTEALPRDINDTTVDASCTGLVCHHGVSDVTCTDPTRRTSRVFRCSSTAPQRKLEATHTRNIYLQYCSRRPRAMNAGRLNTTTASPTKHHNEQQESNTHTRIRSRQGLSY